MCSTMFEDLDFLANGAQKMSQFEIFLQMNERNISVEEIGSNDCGKVNRYHR